MKIGDIYKVKTDGLSTIIGVAKTDSNAEGYFLGWEIHSWNADGHLLSFSEGARYLTSRGNYSEVILLTESPVGDVREEELVTALLDGATADAGSEVQ